MEREAEYRKRFSDFTLLLDPDLFPYSLLIQKQFQQLRQGAKDRETENVCTPAKAFPPLPTKEWLWHISTLKGVLPFVIGKLHNSVSD